MNTWNLMKYKKIYLAISLIILFPGILSLIVNGLNLAIDFTGGSTSFYDVSQSTQETSTVKDSLSTIYKNKNLDIYELTQTEDMLEVKTGPIESALNDELVLEIHEQLPGVIQATFESIGPSIGRETTLNSLKALGWASLAIVIYISLAFRNIPKPYSSIRFGISALVAMLHDAFLLLGVFSLLGKFAGVKTDALFITAVLTVIGFSIHDSIVVFDRIRENLRKLPTSFSFEEVVNFSIVETLNRSFATSLTVLITLMSLYILGGQTIKHFVLALLIGIISGTYSSIFTASPLLVLWEERISKYKGERRKFRFLPFRK